MRILILLFLSISCLIYYGNAAGNSNQVELASADDSVLGEATIRQKRNVPGGETEQDPNDQKYQIMAKELVLNHLRIKEEDTKSIKVNKVTTQVVAGIITRIEIKVTLVSGISDTCNFEVWERIWEHVKHVTFKCLIQKKVLSGTSSKPRPEQTRDPKDPKYQKFAKASIDSLFQTAENKPFKKEDIRKITVTKVKVQIGSKIMNYLVFNVATVNNNNYQCTSTILEKPWDPQETAKVSVVTCELSKGNSKLLLSLSPSKLNLPGGQVDEDPNDPKYQSLAKMSFQRYLNNHRDVNVQVKSIKIDSVTSQVVAGTNIRMHFRVYPTQGSRFECQTKIFETLSGRYSGFNVSCNINMGGEEDQDPDDPQYQQLAKESFQFYLKSHKENVHVKRIKVHSVTTQVVAGMITRIQFDVYPTRGSRFECQSKIFKELGPGRNLEFDVKCHRIVDGEVEQDPDDPQYQQLAKESFQFYLKSHKKNVHVKRIKVDSVTTQVVAGTITRIQFDVYPTRGSRFECQSKIFKKLGPGRNLEFDVKCHSIAGGEVEQDPDDPQYQQLAKESFQFYLKSHKKNVHVKRIKVDSVTTQVVAGTITRIQFDVYPTRGSRFECQSKIFKKLGPGRNLEFDVKCHSIAGGEVEQDPDDPQYQQLAKESFQFYLKSHKKNVHVKRIKVDSVTTQVVAGTITRIQFDVYPTRGSRFECQSKIFKKLGPGRNLEFDVKCHSIAGGEVEQDPDDPQYQQLAKESFQFYLKSHKKNVHVKRIKVDSVTTQVVAGTITRIQFDVYPTRGSRFECQSKIFKKLGPGRNLEFDVKCHSIAGGEVEQDPDDPQYQQLAKESFQFYLKSHKKNVHVKRIKVDSVTTQVVAGTITRIQFDVYPTRGSRFECQSKIFKKLGPGRNLEFDVKCHSIAGGEVEQDPDDPQYQQLAKESFQFYLKSHKKNVHVKRIKVDSVTTQVVAGTITRIQFDVYPTRGSRFECQSKIFKKVGPGRNLEFDVKCHSIAGGEVEQDPDDPQYQQLAKESFQFYLKSHKKNVHVKRIKVDSVTTQVVAGTITRIQFDVYPTRGSRFECQSKIFKELGPGRNLEFDVKCHGIAGGEEEQDPDDPQYQQLAIESFKFYLKSHKENVQVKRIKVDSVTTQVVAGMITRIQFDVYPTRGSRFDCQSKIFKKLGPPPNLEFDVKCHRIHGGEEEKDPNEPQFQQLAKESFRKYRETHIGPLFAIKEQKVTRATTQVVAGLITRLDFYVTTTEGGKYTCHSEIYEQRWEKIKKIDVNCNFVGTGGNAKLALKLNSNSKRINFAAEAVKRYLEDEYKKLDLKVTRSKTKSIKKLTTRVSKQKITYYEVDAFAHVPHGDNSMFNCSVLAGSWFGKKPIATNCIKVEFNIFGGSTWSDPTNKKYLSFAEKSLQLYLKNSPENEGPRDYRKYDVIVTFNKRGLAAGYVNYINFVARWVHGNDDDPGVFICRSKVWEKFDGINDMDAWCRHVSWDRGIYNNNV